MTDCIIPTVDIDAQSGFCHGVVAAIRKAESELERSGRLYCLGDIVHNSDEVDRLRKLGLVTINHEDLAQLHDVKILLRAHGEPPSTYEIARRNNIEIIDATCPVVLQLQRRVRAAYDSNPQQQILIYGKNGHAEVNGLVGQVEGHARVIEDVEVLSQSGIDWTRDVALFSQTTKSIEGFRALKERIEHHLMAGASLSAADTICRQVSNRVKRLQEFARGHDVVIFVSGHKSSNGKILYDQCRHVNSSTFLVANEDELQDEWLRGRRTIGVCGATSTPRWLMEKVRDHIVAMTGSQIPQG